MITEAINILDLVDEMGESFVESWLSLFSCPHNPEIEHYIKNNALEFAKKGISITYLVFGQDQSNTFLVGYYALTYKILRVERSSISRTTEKRIARFGDYDELSGTYSLAAPLIAQFGKNYADSVPAGFHGTELMSLVLDQLQKIQRMAGGRLVYLECEDNPFLLDFYSRQGFTPFAKRYTTGDDKELFYHQMMKILK